MKVKSLSRVRLLATPWTAGYQAPPSMGFSRQESWSGVPLLLREPSQISTNKKPEKYLDSKECSWDENTDSQLERLPETGFHRSSLEDRDPCKAEFIEMYVEANGAEPRIFQAWKFMITFCLLLQLFVSYY